jgi:hypothetical protein
MIDNLPTLQKINQHLNIALIEMTNNPGIFFGQMQEQRKLIQVKLKLEHLVDRITKEENKAKQKIFNRIKQ